MSNSGFRTETDSIGSMQVPADALYGIHSCRAVANFPEGRRFHIEWFKAMGMVKMACYQTYSLYANALKTKHGSNELPVNILPESVIHSLLDASREVAEGRYFDSFVVPAVNGGAGTSINMNVNEIIANLALLKSGHQLAEYHLIDPIEAANIYQSTNDVVPTALRVAMMQLFTKLETNINALRQKVEHLENVYRHELRIGYTQMQEAVPSSYGMLFSAYSEALSRDWWRISKCFERIKTVNLGGSAIGTGMAVPRFYIMEVVKVLQQLTGLPVSRSENMPDATQNLDSLVEVHAIIKSHAVNLEKMVSDIRLLASDVAKIHGVMLPQKQVGSSIMPGKVNPVIAEYVVSVSHKVYANDVLISALCAQGCLDLNAYLPVIGDAILESLKLLCAADKTLADNYLEGLYIPKGVGIDQLMHSPAITTALSPVIGYKKAALLAKEMKANLIDVLEANRKLNAMDEEKLKLLLQPENLLKTGFTLSDIS
jgi:aspartate ammonia-lyase